MARDCLARQCGRAPTTVPQLAPSSIPAANCGSARARTASNESRMLPATSAGPSSHWLISVVALSLEVLVWARRTAGLSPAAAAAKLRFRDTKRRTASERLQAMESGAERPSRSVLKRMVKAYHQPLVVFYMSQPQEDHLTDDAFRTLNKTLRSKKTPTLNLLVQDVNIRQGIARELLEDEGEIPLDSVGSATLKLSPRDSSFELSRRIAFSLQGPFQSELHRTRVRTGNQGHFQGNWLQTAPAAPPLALRAAHPVQPPAGARSDRSAGMHAW